MACRELGYDRGYDYVHGYGTGTVWRTYGSAGECGMTKGRLAECVSGVAAACTHQADVGVRCFMDAGGGKEESRGRRREGRRQEWVPAGHWICCDRVLLPEVAFGMEWSSKSCNGMHPP